MKSGFNDQNEMGVLYLVGTPIGNLEDITYRAKRVLGEVDTIFAEDTRKSRVLLSHLEIFNKAVVRYSEHDRAKSTQEVLNQLILGRQVALVTDAGMPSISDPGSHLVRAAVSGGHRVVVVPGPTAESAAVALAGVVDGPYLFVGFVRSARKWLKEQLSAAATANAALVGYLSPHDVAKVLFSLTELIGDEASVVLCREMTKLYEERIEGSLSELLENRRVVTPKGEYVLIIPSSSLPRGEEVDHSLLTQVIELCLDGDSTRSDRAKRIASLTGLARSQVYEALGG